MFIIKLW